MKQDKTVLVTGAAGFIGFHVCKALLERGEIVAGLDNLSPYYDVTLKEARLDQLREYPQFHFCRRDIAVPDDVTHVFEEHQPDNVIHLAAQAGVRDSLKNPRNYTHSNITGFLNILEACRNYGTAHLVYASSGSVYGLNRKMPFSVHDSTEHPVSLYAASKKSNEMMAHAYSHLFQIPTTGLRFFSVYGPWGRPDMALFQFAEAILAGKPIDVYNYGNMQRDFTYIDDIVTGILHVLAFPPAANPDWPSTLPPDPATSSAPYRIFNIGSTNPVDLMRFIEMLEVSLGKTTEKNLLPMQPGDVPASHADVSELFATTGFRPNTSIEEGIMKFVAWYKGFYGV